MCNFGGSVLDKSSDTTLYYMKTGKRSMVNCILNIFNVSLVLRFARSLSKDK